MFFNQCPNDWPSATLLAPEKAPATSVQVGNLHPAHYYWEQDRWVLGCINNLYESRVNCESRVNHVIFNTPLPIAHLTFVSKLN
jgi:hypothetical protein